MFKKILMSFLGVMLLYGFFLYADVNYEDGGVIEVESGGTYYHQWPDNPGKVLLLEWLLEAIENGYVEFDNEGHNIAFTNKINAVIGTAHSANWEGAYNKIEMDLKKQAALWITTISDKKIVMDLLDITAHMYSNRTPWIETGENFKQILFQSLSTNSELQFYASKTEIHFAECSWQYMDGMKIHHAGCSKKVVWKLPDPAPSPSPK